MLSIFEKLEVRAWTFYSYVRTARIHGMVDVVALDEALALSALHGWATDCAMALLSLDSFTLEHLIGGQSSFVDSRLQLQTDYNFGHY